MNGGVGEHSRIWCKARRRSRRACSCASSLVVARRFFPLIDFGYHFALRTVVRVLQRNKRFVISICSFVPMQIAKAHTTTFCVYRNAKMTTTTTMSMTPTTLVRNTQQLCCLFRRCQRKRRHVQTRTTTLDAPERPMT
jgi:hypothetical protein